MTNLVLAALGHLLGRIVQLNLLKVKVFEQFADFRAIGMSQKEFALYFRQDRGQGRKIALLQIVPVFGVPEIRRGDEKEGVRAVVELDESLPGQIFQQDRFQPLGDRRQHPVGHDRSAADRPAWSGADSRHFRAAGKSVSLQIEISARPLNVGEHGPVDLFAQGIKQFPAGLQSRDFGGQGLGMMFGHPVEVHQVSVQVV